MSDAGRCSACARRLASRRRWAGGLPDWHPKARKDRRWPCRVGGVKFGVGRCEDRVVDRFSLLFPLAVADLRTRRMASAAAARGCSAATMTSFGGYGNAFQKSGASLGSVACTQRAAAARSCGGGPKLEQQRQRREQTGNPPISLTFLAVGPRPGSSGRHVQQVGRVLRHKNFPDFERGSAVEQRPAPGTRGRTHQA